MLTPDELEVAAAYYDIGTAGEMHHDPGKNVLFVSDSTAAIALAHRPAKPRNPSSCCDSAQDKLRAARAQRPAPFVDRTRYTNWNAMMASAMLRAAAVLDDEWAGARPADSAPPPAGERRAGCRLPTRRAASPACWTIRCRRPPPRSMPTRRPETRSGSTGPSA